MIKCHLVLLVSSVDVDIFFRCRGRTELKGKCFEHMRINYLNQMKRSKLTAVIKFKF